MYIADLHIHSRFSRACSPQLNIPNLVEWAKLKGIDLFGIFEKRGKLRKS